MEQLVIDTRQQKNKHAVKHSFFYGAGLEVIEHSLYAGDYMLVGTGVSIDTKRNIQELSQDIMGKDHDRFRAELIRAQEAGIKLIILTETNHVASLDELSKWREPNNEWCRRGGKPRLEAYLKKNKKALPKNMARRIYGSVLAKSCRTMEKKYGCEFYFVTPNQAGEWVLDALLTSPPNDKMTYEYITQPVTKEKPETDPKIEPVFEELLDSVFNAQGGKYEQ